MTDSRAALDIDRLPWLTDERKPRPTRQTRWVIIVPWALLAGVLIAGVSYWLGMRSRSEPEIITGNRPSHSMATAILPEPGTDQSQIVEPSPMRDMELAPEPAPATPESKPKTGSPQKAVAKPPAREKAEQSTAVKQSPIKSSPKLEYWPAFESSGASGRMVRIGTFSSRRQAKKGWWAIVRHYPGMRRLRAVVAPVPSLRNGRVFYRLQFGTTSQAHSEILCQRMRMIAQSCVVVGLRDGQEGKAK